MVALFLFFSLFPSLSLLLLSSLFYLSFFFMKQSSEHVIYKYICFNFRMICLNVPSICFPNCERNTFLINNNNKISISINGKLGFRKVYRAVVSIILMIRTAIPYQYQSPRKFDENLKLRMCDSTVVFWSLQTIDVKRAGLW